MTDETQVPDVMGMSDEDFLSQDFSEVVTDVEEASIEQEQEPEAEETEEETSTEVVDEVDEESEEEEAEIESSEESSEGTSDASEEESIEESDDEESEDTEETGGDKVDNEEEAIEDYQAQIDELFAPIKANGKEVKVNSIDEARKLMSMGMGFTKKMETLKPARLLQQKMREHGLLEEGKLDFLIALDKKDPDAIAQLVKDAKIDPLNLDLESDSSYQPEAYSGGKDTLALDDVITELENSDYAPDLAELISTKWGESSREVLRESPALLQIIDSHMHLGIYDSIMDRVDQEKRLGSYMGVSDIVAYGQVAEQMNSEGQFAHLNAPAQGKRVEEKPRTITKAIKPKAKVDPNLDRKKATAVTKSAPVTKKTETPYLGMTDEDFLASM